MKIPSTFQNKRSLSKRALAIILVAWMAILFNNKVYNGSMIRADITYYYSYLPAQFVYHDLEFGYIYHNIFFSDKLWPEEAPNGKNVSKTTMGQAMLWLPFFAAGHWTAGWLNYPQSGYGPPYYFFLMIGTLFYLSLGMLALYKVLIRYFSDAATALTLLSVFFGTNLLYYSTLEPLMPHVFMFSFISMLVYLTIVWHERPGILYSLLFGFLAGLLVLMRPTHLLILVVPLLYNVYDKVTLRNKLKLLRENIFQLIIAIVAFAIVFIPQLLYWKKITGGWLYYSYGIERFYFGNPHILEGLFSYRKGWLVYTPIMAFSIIGFIYLKKYCRSLFYPLLFIFITGVYLTLSWWCWWYGGSYGLRAFVDYYSILALPMAALFMQILKSGKVFRIAFISLTFFLVSLSCFQTYQKKRGVIHYDGMTREVYWMVFGRLNPPKEYWNKLKQPDYDKARAGLPAD